MVIAADISSDLFDPRPLRAATLALLPSVIGRREVTSKGFWRTVHRATQIAEDAKSQSELVELLEEFVRTKDFQRSTRHFAKLFFSHKGKLRAGAVIGDGWPNLSPRSASRISFGVAMVLAHDEIFRQPEVVSALDETQEAPDLSALVDSSDTPLPIASLLTRSMIGSAAMLALTAKSAGHAHFSTSREEYLALLWRRGVVSLLTIAALTPGANVQKRAVSSKQREDTMRKVWQWQSAVVAFRAMPVAQVVRE